MNFLIKNNKKIIIGATTIQDGDYYQKFSYSLRSKVPLQNWEDVVSALNHTAGFKKFSDLILKRYKLKKLNFTKTEQIVPYVDQMFYLLGKTYDKLQTFVPIQDYQIDHYKNRFLKYIKNTN